MFDKQKHQTILIKILKEIYSDSLLAKNLGFKGGTALYLFYDLPRMSVDLDFNLIDEAKKDLIFEKIKKILSLYGKLEEATEKRYTLFFLLNYEKTQRKIKVEISKRAVHPYYEIKNYLGIPIFVVDKKGLASGKLSAFLTRKKFASRDLFDLWFILKNEFDFDENYLKKQIKLDLKSALRKAMKKVKTIKPNQLLQGIGELIEEKQKNWIKEKLKNEVLFYLNLYLKNKD
ncbi:MAG: nucleotidyl transferase AbiEii/AbiGii toxin family protein [Patescibacteria group bacterium]|nr:nucleotidyl transferase AbiEii/AbiGii toxin family protein [Patescibacteria group bacterium]